MFCRNCGKEIDDKAGFCANCGCPTENFKKDSMEKYNKSRGGIGFLFGLIFGVLGLIIGLLMYPSDTVARSTFLQCWTVTFVSAILFAVMVGVWLM